MTFETFLVAEEHVDGYAALISEKTLSEGFGVSMADMDLISDEIRQDMANPQLTDFLAKDSETGKIVGFVLWKYPANNLFKSAILGNESDQATRDQDSILIRELFVHEQHRRRGIGNELMQHAIKLAEERSARIILVPTSKEGEALYIKLGFKEARSDSNKVTYMVRYPEKK